ncbi:hypothetical protein SMD11_3355 [Streptomyces albireticuli]|uniref:Uncharacterized protein n=1 Tax=Streptomyces albireticuli TaxID=1940 RepID=A0A1Z2L453_9ACTN|nr:hypothetical protein SMD11_3355 [Streptomyces albireticuli]
MTDRSPGAALRRGALGPAVALAAVAATVVAATAAWLFLRDVREPERAGGR